MKITNKTVVLGIVLAIALAGIATWASAQGDNVYTGCLTDKGEITNVAIGHAPAAACKEGKETQITWSETGPQGIQGETGPKGDQGDPGPQGIQGPPGPAVEQHIGTKVAEGLYDVHTRVLWDVGWTPDNAKLPDANYFFYDTTRKNLVYGSGQATFLAPLKSGLYGIPAVPEGATRKARLYVHYGHGLGCNGEPTVMIGNVELNLPPVNGAWSAVAANWSNYRTEAEYDHLWHEGIHVYLKNGTGCTTLAGAIYRVEAHFAHLTDQMHCETLADLQSVQDWQSHEIASPVIFFSRASIHATKLLRPSTRRSHPLPNDDRGRPFYPP